jgi:hypothetical protein
MFDRSTLPPLDRALLARTAEMLALPERVCRRRDCRRRGRCGWFFKDTRQPCCLANLDAAQRRLFDEFAEQVRDVRDYGNLHSKLAYASPFVETRALQDAAVEVARTLLSGAALREFRAFAALRDTHPPASRAGEQPPLPKGW